jgi:hypothetical protein
MAQAFEVASLNGTYTGLVLGEGGRFPVAAVMILNLDGNGNVTGGRALFNVPDPINVGQRMAQEIALPAGSYQVSPEGKGTASLPALFIATWTFSILRGEPQANGMVQAQEVVWIGDTLDPLEANLMSGTFKRLPDGATFSEASLKGAYTRRFRSFGNQLPMVGFGKFDQDGAGVGSGDSTLNVPGATAFERQVFTNPGSAQFTVSADGFITLVPLEDPSGTIGNGMFVITQAEPQTDGSFLATDARGVLELPSLGGLLQFSISRRGE